MLAEGRKAQRAFLLVPTASRAKGGST